jgi:hypothetical protein
LIIAEFTKLTAAVGWFFLMVFLEEWHDKLWPEYFGKNT